MVSILYKQPWLLVLSSIAYIYINLRINYCRHVQGCGKRLQVEPHPVHASNVVKKDILPGSAQVLSRCISEYLLNIVSKIIMVVCLFFLLLVSFFVLRLRLSGFLAALFICMNLGLVSFRTLLFLIFNVFFVL